MVVAYGLVGCHATTAADFPEVSRGLLVLEGAAEIFAFDAEAGRPLGPFSTQSSAAAIIELPSLEAFQLSVGPVPLTNALPSRALPMAPLVHVADLEARAPVFILAPPPAWLSALRIAEVLDTSACMDASGCYPSFAEREGNICVSPCPKVEVHPAAPPEAIELSLEPTARLACGPLERQGLNATDCQPVTGRCPEDGWPTAPADLYVRPSTVGTMGGQGDGSKDAPFATLEEALLAATEGARIALAPGEYPFVQLTKSMATVSLIGACDAVVIPSLTVMGQASLEAVSVQTLTVASGGRLTVRRSIVSDVDVEGVLTFTEGRLANGSGAGVFRIQDAQVDLLSLQAEAALNGVVIGALSVAGRGPVTIESSRLLGQSTFSANGVTISQTIIANDMQVEGGALSLTDVLMYGQETELTLGVTGGDLMISRVLMRATRMVAAAQAQVTAEDLHITEAVRDAVAFVDSTLGFSRVLIDNIDQSKGLFGMRSTLSLSDVRLQSVFRAIDLSTEVEAEFERVEIAQSGLYALCVAELSRLRARHLAIDVVQNLDEDATLWCGGLRRGGFGIAVDNGATLDMEAFRIAGAVDVALVARGARTTRFASGAIVENGVGVAASADLPQDALMIGVRYIDNGIDYERL